MGYRSIEGIRIGAHAGVSPSSSTEGEAFGGTIYGFNMQVGFTDQPTKLSLNIVNEEGVYPDLTDQLTYLDPHRLELGGITFYMYLVSFNKSSSPDSKTLQCNFIDGSHLLDRIFVGLINRHSSDSDKISQKSIRFELPFNCPPCGLEEDEARIVNFSSVRTERTVDFSNFTPIGNNIDGGFILLGEEEWAQTSCDLPNVSYNFTDLKEAAAGIGLDINITDKAPSLRQNFEGSLRDVLNQWCSAFGVSFTWDYSSNPGSVSEINLNNPVLGDKITEIGETAKLIKGTKGALVEGIEESASLENTEKQFVSVQHARRASQRPFEMTTNFLTFSKSITPMDIFETGLAGQSSDALDGRTFEQFYISLALAKYNKSARTLWNMSNGHYKAEGFIAQQDLADADARRIAQLCLNVETFNAMVNQWGDFTAWIGVYSEDVHSRIVDWEKDIANSFLGKYWVTNLQAKDKLHYCNDTRTFRFSVQSQLDPRGERFFAGSMTTKDNKALPFRDVLYGPMAEDLWSYLHPAETSSQYVTISNRSDGAWYGEQKDVDAIFQDEDRKDQLEFIMPKFQTIEGKIELNIRNLGAALHPNILESINDLKRDNKIPYIVWSPKPDKIREYLSVKNIATDWINTKELLWNEKDTSNVAPSCTLVCEEEQSVELEACSCAGDPLETQAIEIGQIYDANNQRAFAPGIYDKTSFGFTLTFNNVPDNVESSLDIVFPVGSLPNSFSRMNYAEQVKRGSFATATKEVLNNFDTVGNVSRIKVLHKDISQPLAAFDQVGQPTLINIYIPGTGLTTIEEHYNLLASLLTNTTEEVRRQITITFAGLDFGTIKPYIKPENGLESFNIQFGDQGITTSMSFANRPTKSPVPETLMTHFGPRQINSHLI